MMAIVPFMTTDSLNYTFLLLLCNFSDLCLAY